MLLSFRAVLSSPRPREGSTYGRRGTPTTLLNSRVMSFPCRNVVNVGRDLFSDFVVGQTFNLEFRVTRTSTRTGAIWRATSQLRASSRARYPKKRSFFTCPKNAPNFWYFFPPKKSGALKIPQTFGTIFSPTKNQVPLSFFTCPKNAPKKCLNNTLDFLTCQVTQKEPQKNTWKKRVKYLKKSPKKNAGTLTCFLERGRSALQNLQWRG